jgi:hypothetical protein
MDLVAKYRLRAEQCRALAARTRIPEHKHALEAMAREWESIASHGAVDMSEVPLISIIDDDSLASEGM